MLIISCNNKENIKGNLVKVSFKNSDLKDLNADEFGKNAAKKIYNFSDKTKQLKSVWIYVENEKDVIAEKTSINLSSIAPQLKLNKKRNLFYKPSELE